MIWVRHGGTFARNVIERTHHSILPNTILPGVTIVGQAPDRQYPIDTCTVSEIFNKIFTSAVFVQCSVTVY